MSFKTKRESALWVKQSRAFLGVSQVVFARLVGCSEQAVFSWESGQNQPSERFFNAINSLVTAKRADMGIAAPSPVEPVFDSRTIDTARTMALLEIELVHKDVLHFEEMVKAYMLIEDLKTEVINLKDEISQLKGVK